MSPFSDRRRGRVQVCRVQICRVQVCVQVSLHKNSDESAQENQTRESEARHENRFSGSQQTLIHDGVTVDLRAAEDLPLA